MRLLFWTPQFLFVRSLARGDSKLGTSWWFWWHHGSLFPESHGVLDPWLVRIYMYTIVYTHISYIYVRISYAIYLSQSIIVYHIKSYDTTWNVITQRGVSEPGYYRHVSQLNWGAGATPTVLVWDGYWSSNTSAQIPQRKSKRQSPWFLQEFELFWLFSFLSFLGC